MNHPNPVPDLRDVLRLRRAPWVWPAAFLALPVASAILAITILGSVVWFVLACAAAACILLCAMRLIPIRVHALADALEVRYALKTQRIPWRAVGHVQVQRNRAGHGKFIRVMTAEGRWLGTIGSAWLSGTAEDAAAALTAAKNARCLAPAA